MVEAHHHRPTLKQVRPILLNGFGQLSDGCVAKQALQVKTCHEVFFERNC
jgi:hypothetical protein